MPYQYVKAPSLMVWLQNKNKYLFHASTYNGYPTAEDVDALRMKGLLIGDFIRCPFTKGKIIRWGFTNGDDYETFKRTFDPRAGKPKLLRKTKGKEISVRGEVDGDVVESKEGPTREHES